MLINQIFTVRRRYTINLTKINANALSTHCLKKTILFQNFATPPPRKVPKNGTRIHLRRSRERSWREREDEDARLRQVITFLANMLISILTLLLKANCFIVLISVSLERNRGNSMRHTVKDAMVKSTEAKAVTLDKDIRLRVFPIN